MELKLSPVQRKERTDEALEALSAAMKVASSNSVDAVLIPGNLFDADNVTSKTLSRVQKIFALLGDIPVFISPGVDDPLFSDSPYDVSALRAHGLSAWSDNVQIFSAERVQSFALPEKGSVKISGIGMPKHARLKTPYVPALEEAEKVAINILLLPLGLEDKALEASTEELKVRVQNRSYSYVALSGCKNEMLLKASDEVIFGAAAGTFVGQTEAERGPRQALFGNLDRRLGGGIELALQSQEFDPRRIISLKFDLSGNLPETYNESLQALIKKSKARKDTDIIVLELEGLYPGGAAFELVSAEMRQSYFHMKIVDKTRPDYLETLTEKNIIENKLIAILGELKNKIKAEQNNDQLEQLAVLDDALYFGLQAIREGKVSIRDAD